MADFFCNPPTKKAKIRWKKEIRSDERYATHLGEDMMRFLTSQVNGPSGIAQEYKRIRLDQIRSDL